MSVNRGSISCCYNVQKQRVDLSDYFSVLNTGNGSGWSQDIPSMSSVINFNSKLYLVDIPPNIHFVLAKLNIDIDSIAGIFQTHAHDDHMADIFSFLKTNKKIKYISTKLIRENICRKVFSSIDRSYFNEFFDIVDLELDTWNNIDGLEVKPFLSAHPVDTTCLRFRVKNINTQEYKTYVHLADISSFKFLDDMLQNEEIDNSFVEKIRANYLEPANIKKIDVGGGLIHGCSDDYINDISDTLVYSHLCERQYLTLNRRFIENIGHVNTFIKGDIDYSLVRYKEIIKNIFDFCSNTQVENILSTRKVFKPQENISNYFDNSNDILMVVSGICIFKNKFCKEDIYKYPGFLMGKNRYNKYNQDICIADGYVEVVVVPVNIFEQKFSSLSDEFYENENFLHENCPFEKNIDTQVAFEIASRMKKINIEKNVELSKEFF